MGRLHEMDGGRKSNRSWLKEVEMAKRVFFSFHYKDVESFRANIVRNHWKTKLNREICGYYDASIWESARKEGPLAIKRLINKGLKMTSNTCVLIGSETYKRPWVRYEILKSLKKGNKIFAVHINSIKNKNSSTSKLGPNPFNYVAVTISDSGKTATLWEKKYGKWIKFDKINGSASYRVRAARKYWGESIILSQWYKTYDWVKNNGYENFATWVK